MSSSVLSTDRTHGSSVGVTAAAGRVSRHGLYIVLVLLVVARRLQAKVVTMVRWQHPHRDVRGLPGVVRCQDI